MCDYLSTPCPSEGQTAMHLMAFIYIKECLRTETNFVYFDRDDLVSRQQRQPEYYFLFQSCFIIYQNNITSLTFF